VKKWNLVDQTPTPDGRSIELREHDGVYEIHVGSFDLMSTRRHASEDKIAELACADLKQKRNARVLIGGLGMGFTLKATLEAVARDATVVVAEIMPAVIAWNRNPAYPLAGLAMQDRRVTIVEKDVAQVIRSSQGQFDAIILDVDNGPAALTTDGNARLYTEEGLRRTRAALTPTGCAAFWAAGPDAPFEKLFRRAGFDVETVRCRAHVNSGGWHYLFMGRRSTATGRPVAGRTITQKPASGRQRIDVLAHHPAQSG